MFFGICIFALGVIGWDLGHVAYYSHWFSHQLLTLPYTPQKAKEVESLFSQTFTYLDQGSTSEVFVSEDGSAVIKVFLKKSYASKSRLIPVFNRLAAHRKALKMQWEMYQSCLNSYALLPQETGMLYYHLEPTTHFNQAVTLRDAEGHERLLDLDRDVYFIQKKAEVANHYLENCIANNQLQKAERGITHLLEFTLLLYRQGIVMVDLQFTSNFGFIDDLPVRIDVEHLCFKESWKTEHETHLIEQLRDFRMWIANYLPPSLLTYFDAEVARLLNVRIAEVDVSER